jgi:hypothetical protein
MNSTTGHTQDKVRRRAIRVAKVITPARLLRGLAMGAMLIAATAFVYQELSQGEAHSLSSSNQVTETAAAPNYLGSEEHKTEGMSSDAVHNSTVDRSLSNIELERMDYETDMMLWAAARKPSESNPISNREIERLESQIDRLLADAARDPSRNTPLLNREIERLDYQIDMLRLNAMQNQSVDRPLSSEPSGTWPRILIPIPSDGVICETGRPKLVEGRWHIRHGRSELV